MSVTRTWSIFVRQATINNPEGRALYWHTTGGGVPDRGELLQDIRNNLMLLSPASFDSDMIVEVELPFLV